MSPKLLKQDTYSPENRQPQQTGELWQPFPDLAGVRGGISLRADGSMSWNAEPHDQILRNRISYFEEHGLDPRQAVAADQVHGAEIIRVTQAHAGRGFFDRESRIPAADALITNERRLILTTLHADCAPIFYADPAEHAIGLAHAGRRGILAGVAGNVLRRMAAEFGSDPRAVQVAVGPTISTYAYEVERSVAEDFAARFGQQVISEVRNHNYLDLLAALTVDLLGAGLNPSFIPARPWCTASNLKCSSYRRDGSSAGSMMAWLCMT